jgi:hypothetical protein
MAGTYPIGRGVKVEVEATTAAAKSVTAVTQAAVGVATSASHALAEGAIAYFTGVSGMVQLEGQAISVDAPVTNTINLEGLNTTNFPAFTGTANLTPIATWSTVGNASGYQIGGGDANDVDQTTLIDDIQQLTPGLLNAQTVSISGFSAFSSAAMQKVIQAAYDQTPLTFRVTLKNGERRVFRGIPALAGEDMQVGQSATGQFSVRVTGRVLFLPAA